MRSTASSSASTRSGRGPSRCRGRIRRSSSARTGRTPLEARRRLLRRLDPDRRARRRSDGRASTSCARWRARRAAIPRTHLGVASTARPPTPTRSRSSATLGVARAIFALPPAGRDEGAAAARSLRRGARSRLRERRPPLGAATRSRSASSASVREVPRRAAGTRSSASGSPFLEWEWLASLEEAGSRSARDDGLAAAAPDAVGRRPAGRRLPALREGAQRMGEFVFDHGWASAAQRARHRLLPEAAGRGAVHARDRRALPRRAGRRAARRATCLAGALEELCASRSSRRCT